MLQINVPGKEFWDEANEVFVYSEDKTLVLEHSLVSLSKWESKWKKPFLTDKPLNKEELIYYVRCMTITQNVSDDVYERITPQLLEQIMDYTQDPMTATWIREEKTGKRGSEQITSELIYYWMVSMNIPFECQKWHLNRLLTLIRICSIKNQPAKNMKHGDVLRQYAAINAARRKQTGSRG